MKRRTVLQGVASLTGALMFARGLPVAQAMAQDYGYELNGPSNPLAAPWAQWKATFLSPEGRVVDLQQQGASHSESQGYGLLLAAIFGDTAAFDLIYQWTEANLAVRSDALLAWRWLPSGPSRVPDKNNASDGDLFYAWGLVLRAQRDGMPELLDRANRIAYDLVGKCVISSPDGSGRLLFAPAAQGFDRGQGVVINPSYYMPRAMRAVAQATGANDLAICASDGESLLSELSAGGLTPDWIQVGPDGITPAVGMSDNNGYEAMRVALFLSWSGNPRHLAVLRQAQAYRQAVTAGAVSAGEFVTVFERSSGNVIETSRQVGYGAIAALVNCVAATEYGAAIPFYRTADQPYYPATLHLMTLIAQIQSAATCEPI